MAQSVEKLTALSTADLTSQYGLTAADAEKVVAVAAMAKRQAIQAAEKADQAAAPELI